MDFPADDFVKRATTSGLLLLVELVVESSMSKKTTGGPIKTDEFKKEKRDTANLEGGKGGVV